MWFNKYAKSTDPSFERSHYAFKGCLQTFFTHVKQCQGMV